jgi:hypothetical protein
LAYNFEFDPFDQDVIHPSFYTRLADAMETDDNPEDDGADFLLTDTGDDVNFD